MRTRILALIAISFGSIALAAPAQAGDGVAPGQSAPAAGMPAAQEETYPEDDYLDDVMTLDTTNLALTIVTAGYGSVITVPSYLLGAPIIHAAHGNRGEAAVSLTMRVALPVLGGAIANSMYERRQDRCDSGYCDSHGPFEQFFSIAAGAVIGATGAVVFDWIVLDHTTRVPVQRTRALVAPQVGIGERGLSLGVSGSF
jgi:hypothetical protein